MPQEPKKRHSRQRQGKRRAKISLNIPKWISCPNCQNPVLPHIACQNCGFYKGRLVLVKKSKKPNENTS